MDEVQVLTFLKQLVVDYEQGKLSEEQKKVVSEFFMEFKFLGDEREKTSREMMKYLFLGWFIHETFGKK